MNPLKRAQDLVRLAADPRTPKEEASDAALQACKHIAKFKLLEDPIRSVTDKVPVEVREAVDAVRETVDLVSALYNADPVKKLRDIGKNLAQQQRRRRPRRYED